MANYYGNGRSNYFKVKDMAAFLEWLDTRAPGMEVASRHMVDKKRERELLAEDPTQEICLLAETEDGDYPSWIYNEEDGDDEEVDFIGELSKHLLEETGNVFIWQHVGNEKLRYVSGYAIAITHDGKTFQVSIRDIYDKVCEELDITEVSHCEY